MTDFLISLFVKNRRNVKDPKVRKSYGTLGGIVGIICNLLLCAIKITVGVITGSISITADGFNNLADMGSSVVTIIGFKLAGKPADSDHPFGHGRMEYMSAFIVSVFIIIVGVDLFETSATALRNNSLTPEYGLWPIILLVISVLVKFWLFLFNKKLGRKISSDVLKATAKDSLNDALTTLAILVSVGISSAIELPFNLDAVMGLLVSVFILWSGLNSAKDTIDEILGRPPEKSLIKDLEETILSVDEFIGIHDLLVHNYGPGRQFASVHVEVPQNTDIVKCHEQIDLCEKEVKEKLDVDLVIHMDPIDNKNPVVEEAKSRICEALKIIDERLTLHDFRMTPIAETRTNLIFDVLVPMDFKISDTELKEKICTMAKLINTTFECVITVDRDYTGIH